MTLEEALAASEAEPVCTNGMEKRGGGRAGGSRR